MILLRVCQIVNRPITLLCEHAFGEDHTPAHRMGAGLVIMAVGVTTAHGLAVLPFVVAPEVGELLGYLVHGIGTVPFVEAVLARSRH
jgi:hypothetical protein